MRWGLPKLVFEGLKIIPRIWYGIFIREESVTYPDESDQEEVIHVVVILVLAHDLQA